MQIAEEKMHMDNEHKKMLKFISGQETTKYYLITLCIHISWIHDIF